MLKLPMIQIPVILFFWLLIQISLHSIIGSKENQFTRNKSKKSDGSKMETGIQKISTFQPSPEAFEIELTEIQQGATSLRMKRKSEIKPVYNSRS